VNDGDAPPHDPIEQRGFAHIRATDNGD
jgi:hypothetical protein